MVVAGISTLSNALKFEHAPSTPSASGSVHLYRENNNLIVCGSGGILFDEGGFRRWYIQNGALHPHGTTYNNLGLSLIHI